jgi:hypothetical protein
MRKVAQEDGIDKTLEANGIDILVAPMDSAICSMTAAAGKSTRLRFGNRMLTRSFRIPNRYYAAGVP